MKVKVPHNAVEIIENFQSSDWASCRPLHMLKVVPELANVTPIRKILKQLLLHEYFSVRLMSAQVLHLSGDPEALLHLVYCCLGTHPLLGLTQRAGEKDLPKIARHAILPYSFQLVDEHIDLLVKDLIDPKGNRQMEILAALPEEKIVNRILPLLDERELSFIAAYILARKGRDDGIDILSKSIPANDWRALELSLVGLSHIPTERAEEVLKHYASEGNPIYHDNAPLKSWAQPLAEERLFLLASNGRNPVLDILRLRYSIHSEELYALLQCNLTKLPPGFSLFGTGSRWYRDARGRGSAPDLIAEFANSDDRQEIAGIQSRNAHDLLTVLPNIIGDDHVSGLFTLGLPFLDKRNQIYLAGISVELDRGDWEKAAIDWILHAESYRTGTCVWS